MISTVAVDFVDRTNLVGMEEGAGYVREVTATSVHLPCLSFTHSPQLDESVISCRYNERERGMESHPINTTIVPW
jgi:hypothetical protein